MFVRMEGSKVSEYSPKRKRKPETHCSNCCDNAYCEICSEAHKDEEGEES